VIDPKSLARYGVSGSQGFARLTATVFDPVLLKVRVKKPKMRRTLGYFAQHKFGTAAVGDRVKDLGFEPGDIRRSSRVGAEPTRRRPPPLLNMLNFGTFANSCAKLRIRFVIDEVISQNTLRTINLFVRDLEDRKVLP